MTNLKNYEKTVLDLLVSDAVSPAVLEDIKNHPHIIECYATGNGYLLTVKHTGLPLERNVYSEPMLIGQCGNIETGFIVFVENGELTIECHGWEDMIIPQDYREMDIKIRD